LKLPSDELPVIDPSLLALKMEISRLKEYIRGVKANTVLSKPLAYKLMQSVFDNQTELLKAIETMEKNQEYATVACVM
jgi:hypothetical protein